MRGRPPVALYVHIPFCLSICPYCDFVVVAGRAARGPAARIEQYVAAVVTEIGLRAAAAPAGRALLDSVYIGGGTPSLLSARQVAARPKPRSAVSRTAATCLAESSDGVPPPM